MDSNYLGSYSGCMRIQDMNLVLQSIFKMVNLSGSKCDITGDEFNSILQSDNKCRRSGLQLSGVILNQKKHSWILRRGFVLVTS